MNPLLVTLFHVPQFRVAVLRLPTSEGEEPESSVATALKHLFYRLQCSKVPVSTEYLAKALGWKLISSGTGPNLGLNSTDLAGLELILIAHLKERMIGACTMVRVPQTPDHEVATSEVFEAPLLSCTCAADQSKLQAL